MSNTDPSATLPWFAENGVNLASPKLGATVLHATDEFFASKERLIKDADPVFIPDKYDDNGKWMDGWESRRRRVPGHDHCVLRLEARGIIDGVDINTSHFTGNHPPHASLDGCLSETDPDETTDWTEIVSKTGLNADSHNFVEVASREHFNHLRLHIYPDGGVARLRVYGQPQSAWQRQDPHSLHELSAITNGGRIIGYNDAHYGSPWVILAPGRGTDMGDGWETRRRREPGNDWIIVALGAESIVERVEVDTAHFKGNYPDRCSVESVKITDQNDASLLENALDWRPLMGEQKLEMDRIHTFEGDVINAIGPVTHLRLSIYPDGGVSRFRAFGKLDQV